jgi:tRNA(fMet)-specific endonuclease VapC
VILLDTNALITISNGRSHPVAERLNAEVLAGRVISTSSIVVFELRFGSGKSQRESANNARFDQILAPLRILSFDAEDAALAGTIRATLEAAGTPIGPYDLLIAAQALRHGATLVTANTREFARVIGLNVESWG